jgi:hypothetical protein
MTFQTALVFLAASIISLTASQLLVKWRFGALGLGGAREGSWCSLVPLVLSDAGLWLAGLLIVAGAAAWYLAMTRLPLTLMLPVGTFVSPLIVVGAHLLLGEPLRASQMAAILLVTLGVALLAYLK